MFTECCNFELVTLNFFCSSNRAALMYFERHLKHYTVLLTCSEKGAGGSWVLVEFRITAVDDVSTEVQVCE